jgi:hypothetical protein
MEPTRDQLLAEAQRRGLSVPNAAPEPSQDQLRAEALKRGLISDEQALAGEQPARSPDMPSEMVWNPATNSYIDTKLMAGRILDQDQSMGVATNYLKGIPFIGSYADEAAGQNELEEELSRQIQQVYQERNPGKSLTTQLGSGLLNMLPAAMVMGPGLLANAPRSWAGKTAAGLTLGAAGGATEGAVYGYGEGEEDFARDKAALRGAVEGAIFGGAIGAVTPSVSTAVKGLIGWAKNRPERQAAADLGISVDALKILREAVEADNLDQALQDIRQAGPNAMLADAGPATRGMLDTAIQSGGAASRTAADAMEQRLRSEGDNLTATLDNILGDTQGRATAQRAIRESTAGARGDAFDAAFSSAIDYAAPEGRQVEAVLKRVPRRILDKAIGSANERMVAEGRENAQILFDMDAGTFSELPNVEQLHFVKMALDQIAEDSRSQVGKLTGEGVMAQRLARQVRDATRNAAPAYGDALEISADSISRENAVELGYNFFKPTTRRETVRDAVQGMTGGELAAVRQGLRDQIDDTLARVKSVASDPNTDIRELRQAVQNLSSRDARDKLRMILSRDQVDDLARTLNQAEVALSLRAATATNSRTAGRQMTQSAVREVAEGGVLRTLGRGEVLKTPKDMVAILTGNTPEALSMREQGLYAEIAEVLVGMRGREAERAVNALRNVRPNRPLTPGRAEAVANALLAATDLGLYQSAQEQVQLIGP